MTTPSNPASSAATASIAKTRDFPAPVPAITMASFPSSTFSATFVCHLLGEYPKICFVMSSNVSDGTFLPMRGHTFEEPRVAELFCAFFRRRGVLNGLGNSGIPPVELRIGLRICLLPVAAGPAFQRFSECSYCRAHRGYIYFLYFKLSVCHTIRPATKSL